MLEDDNDRMIESDILWSRVARILFMIVSKSSVFLKLYLVRSSNNYDQTRMVNRQGVSPYSGDSGVASHSPGWPVPPSRVTGQNT